MAVFEFASAAARTRIVATNGPLTYFPVSLRQQVHDLRGCSARVEQMDHRLHVRIDCFEKLFVSRAKIVQPRLAIRRIDESIFRAFTMTGEANLAFAAITWQRFKFLTAGGRARPGSPAWPPWSAFRSTNGMNWM
jgi:hypothetical protein